jgi:hypothetical protein
MQKVRPEPEERRSFANTFVSSAVSALGSASDPEIATSGAFFGLTLCHSAHCKQAFG